MNEKKMSQKEIIDHYAKNGGLPCKTWTLNKITDHIKADLGVERVYRSTCLALRNAAQ